MDIGTKIWYPDQDEVWMEGVVVENDGTGDDDQVHIQSKDDPENEQRVYIKDLHLRNDTCESTEVDDTVAVETHDLVTLTHLHEASILHVLNSRYHEDQIYTQIGNILLAINPFQKLKLYGDQVMAQYSASVDEPTREALAPHVYLVAQNAYENLVQEGKNQSIIISGESGAGKTETTKIILRFLTQVAASSSISSTLKSKTSKTKSKSTPQETISIERQILQSNPVLEAFGNAKTIRNDNSSRFGKFIELQFTPTWAVSGARIRTYLLEKVRVTKQSKGERNFHIFHELLAGASDDQREAWGLVEPAHTAFAYLTHALKYPKSQLRKDGVCDRLQFQKTCTAMSDIGISTTEQERILSTLAAILHLGNVSFELKPEGEDGRPQQQKHDQSQGDDIQIVPQTREHLQWAATLLEVSPETLERALMYRQIQAGNEFVQTSLSLDQAQYCQNALAMTCYGRIFHWLVERINVTLQPRGNHRSSSFIGLLDIFGFESFKNNSLEQLCINYANEALQQQFNTCVFEQEQSIYQKEDIEWNFIDFPNNDLCLELFEQRPRGIFSLLEEEGRIPRGSDAGLASKMYQLLKPARHFSASPLEQRKHQFVIQHYAGHVCYSTKGFVRKNKDLISDEILNLFHECPSSFIHMISKEALVNDQVQGDPHHQASDDDSDDSDEDNYRTKSKSKSKSKSGKSKSVTKSKTLRRQCSSIGSETVGTQFKHQLHELLDVLETTKPHYVRCIKPNDTNAPGAFTRTRVVEQLRSGGVLEAVRVARAGFPIRLGHAEFLNKYQSLCRTKTTTSKTKRKLPKDQVASVVAHLISASDASVRIGRRRIFFQKQTFQALEHERLVRRIESASMVQCQFRSWTAQRDYRVFRQGLICLQSSVRRRIVQRKLWAQTQVRASVSIQTLVRAFVTRRNFQLLRRATQLLQRWTRGVRGRQEARGRRETRSCVVLQRFVRGNLDRARVQRLREAILSVQCWFRCCHARELVKAAKVEARNVNRLQDENQRLLDELRQLKEMMLQPKPEPTLVEEPQVSPAKGKSVTGTAQEIMTTAVPITKVQEGEWTQEQDDMSSNQMPEEFEVENNDRDVEIEGPEVTQIEEDTERMDVIAQVKTKAEEDVQAEIKAQLKAGGGQVDVALVQRLVASQMKRQNLRLHSVSHLTRARPALDEPPAFGPGPIPTGSSSRTLRCDSLRTPSYPSHASPQGSRFRCDSFAADNQHHHQSSFYTSRGPLSSNVSTMSSSGLSRWSKDTECRDCRCKFNFFIRRHHCRQCGHSFCHEHSNRRVALPEQGYPAPVRVCDECFENVVIDSHASCESSDLQSIRRMSSAMDISL